MNQRLTSLAPYASQLLDDAEVRDAARRVATSTTKAYARTRGRSTKRKVSDRKLWRALAQALTATTELLTALVTPPPPPKRRWPAKLALAALVGAGVVLAANADARAAVLGAVGQGGPSGQANVPPEPPPVPEAH